MVKMFIRMDEENIAGEQTYDINRINEYLDTICFEKGLIKDRYDCYSNGTFEKVGGLVSHLSKLEWFTENVKIWLYFSNDNNKDHYEIEDIISVYLPEKTEPLVLMEIGFNRSKLKFAGTSADKILSKYMGYCEEHGICRPQENVFAASGNHAVALMKSIIDDLTKSDFFLYIVNDWYWSIGDEHEDLLGRALGYREETDSLPEWAVFSEETEKLW